MGLVPPNRFPRSRFRKVVPEEAKRSEAKGCGLNTATKEALSAQPNPIPFLSLPPPPCP